MDKMRELRRDNLHLGLAVACELLSRCRREAGYVDEVRLEVGQCLLGQEELAARFRVKRNRIRTVLRSLQRIEFVTIQSSQRGTVARVLDFERYVSIRQKVARTTSHEPTKSPPESPQQDTSAPPPTSRRIRQEGETTTTRSVGDVDDEIPDVLRKKANEIGMTQEGLERLFSNCRGDVELMLGWVLWGANQSYAKNPAGLVLTTSARANEPPLGQELKKTLDRLIKKSRFHWAKQVYGVLKEKNPHVRDGVCPEITKAELGHDRPRNKREARRVIEAINAGRYDVHTGQRAGEAQEPSVCAGEKTGNARQNDPVLPCISRGPKKKEASSVSSEASE